MRKSTQMTLFGAADASLASLPDAELRYLPDWLPAAEADDLYERLRQELEWQQHRVQLFGKWHDCPRLSAWYGDSDALYQYSGQKLRPEPWHPLLRSLRDRLISTTGAACNSVLANWYRDGRDSMGWHADDEPELGTRPTILSISLGASRPFRLRHRQLKTQHKIELTHGSLLVMAGDTQAHWQHALPRASAVDTGRINLTYRQVFGLSCTTNC